MRPGTKPLNRTTRILLIIGGTLSLAIGIVGAFLPVLPTTPFVLLASLCYVRSSQRLYERLMRSRFAGDHVLSILDGKGIPLSTKILSLSISAVMIGYVSMFVTENFLVRMLLGVLYLVQLIFMLSMKTLRRER
ncbi:MAG: YbaN family protein [Ignavibacteriae bacterium]|nr:YbaN family protein [Ignavibacteriota bacterium]